MLYIYFMYRSENWSEVNAVIDEMNRKVRITSAFTCANMCFSIIRVITCANMCFSIIRVITCANMCFSIIRVITCANMCFSIIRVITCANMCFSIIRVITSSIYYRKLHCQKVRLLKLCEYVKILSCAVFSSTSKIVTVALKVLSCCDAGLSKGDQH